MNVHYKKTDTLNVQYYDKNNDNHILIDGSSRYHFKGIYSLSDYSNKLATLYGDIEIFFLYSDSNIVEYDADINKYIGRLKYILNVFNRKSNISNVTVNIIAQDYESCYNSIEKHLYAEPIEYNKKSIDRLILKCRLVKFFGINYSKKLMLVLFIFMKIKNKLIA